MSNQQRIDGHLIEKGVFGWYVLDWDYEHERVISGPFKTKAKAIDWVIRLAGSARP